MRKNMPVPVGKYKLYSERKAGCMQLNSPNLDRATGFCKELYLGPRKRRSGFHEPFSFGKLVFMAIDRLDDACVNIVTIAQNDTLIGWIFTHDASFLDLNGFNWDIPGLKAPANEINKRVRNMACIPALRSICSIYKLIQSRAVIIADMEYVSRGLHREIRNYLRLYDTSPHR